MTLRRLTVFGVHTYPTPTITIERIVASTSGVPPRSLRQLARSFETIPQGRRFPGLAIKCADDTIVLLFRSGKMVGTGPTLEAVTAAFGQVADTLATQGKATRKEEERHAGSNRRKHRGIHVVF
jgi:TATA-box binding protein (TBP) (component of TFIID and TFIIIB)